MSSRAAATRWFDAHLGATIDTMQVAPDGRILWAPRARVLGKHPGWAGWVLDGSSLRLDGGHEVLALDDGAVILVWHDEDGSVIHTTTYTVVQQHERTGTRTVCTTCGEAHA